MARSYEIAGNCLNTASVLLPLLLMTGAATIRPKVFDINIGSDATPADNAAKYAFQRATTTTMTGSSAITPQALDPGDPASLLASVAQGVVTVGPTLTASAFLLQFAVNQRATFRWVAAPGKELVVPATASNGLAVMSLVVGGSAFNTVMSISFEE